MREFWILGSEIYYTNQDTGILRAPEQIHVREVSNEHDKSVQGLKQAVEIAEEYFKDTHFENVHEIMKDALDAFEKVKK